MKIYTRTGDSGDTSLLGGGRVSKSDIRVEAYGDVDEANSALGLVIAALGPQYPLEIGERLRVVQEDLFAIGAHLAAPGSVDGDRVSEHLPPLPTARISLIESWIDDADSLLEPLRQFVLPGGSELGARLHLARTVCRRAERRVIALAGASKVDEGIIVYHNRLSDLLFTYARLANQSAGAEDVPWTGRR